MSVEETIGRLVLEMEREREAHRQTMLVLRGLHSGSIEHSRLTITDEGWTLAPRNGEQAEASDDGV